MTSSPEQPAPARPRELVYYIAVGLDGRISGPDDDFSAFPTEGDHMAALLTDYADALPTAALTALGITAPRTRFDTVLMGWRTYALGLPLGQDSPYQHLRQIVAGRPDRTVGTDVELTSDAAARIRDLKREPGADIWLCGGGNLAARLVDQIDRLILKVNPLTLGAGPRLFDGDYRPVTWRPVSTRTFESGVDIRELVRDQKQASTEDGAGQDAVGSPSRG